MLKTIPVQVKIIIKVIKLIIKDAKVMFSKKGFLIYYQKLVKDSLFLKIQDRVLGSQTRSVVQKESTIISLLLTIKRMCLYNINNLILIKKIKRVIKALRLLIKFLETDNSKQ